MTIWDLFLLASLIANAALVHAIKKWRPWEHAATLQEVAKDTVLMTSLLKAETDRAKSEAEFLTGKCAILENHLKDLTDLSTRIVDVNEGLVKQLNKVTASIEEATKIEEKVI